MSKSYYEVEILFNDKTYETICNRLYIEGVTSILEENGVIKLFFPLTEKNKIEDLKNNLIECDKISLNNITINKLTGKNWNKEWEKTIEPIYIGKKLVVTPSWKKKILKKYKDQKVIVIDPKMSFGTGHNETTQLMLQMMVEHITVKDKKMLDFGCGTSVLAIAGVKLGLNSAVAIDIDVDSIRDSKEYIMLNRTTPNIKLYQKDISQIKEKNFDVISANIISSVIIKNLKNIYTKLKLNGKLFLSGILIAEKDNIIKQLKKNKFRVVEVIEKAEWLGIYCIKQ